MKLKAREEFYLELIFLRKVSLQLHRVYLTNLSHCCFWNSIKNIWSDTKRDLCFQFFAMQSVLPFFLGGRGVNFLSRQGWTNRTSKLSDSVWKIGYHTRTSLLRAVHQKLNAKLRISTKKRLSPHEYLQFSCERKTNLDHFAAIPWNVTKRSHLEESLRKDAS